MNGYLRQSTASQSRTIGPFLDDTDGKTPETGLAIANTDIKLIANGGTSANKNSGGATHRVNGEYSITLNAMDTATVGELLVSVVVAGALPVRAKFFVLTAAVYDALFGSAAAGYSAYAGGDTAGTTTLLSRLSSARAGYLDKLNVSGVLAHTDNAAMFRADVSGLATSAQLATLQTHGDNTWSTADVSALATAAQLATLQTHGDNTWSTADVTGLSEFDPAGDEVEAGVTYETAFRGLFAAVLGVISTARENSEIYAAVGNAGTTRLTVAANADGDRNAVTIS